MKKELLKRPRATSFIIIIPIAALMVIISLLPQSALSEAYYTYYLRDGRVIVGAQASTQAGVITIRIITGEISFLQSDVWKIEKNGKLLCLDPSKQPLSTGSSLSTRANSAILSKGTQAQDRLTEPSRTPPNAVLATNESETANALVLRRGRSMLSGSIFFFSQGGDLYTGNGERYISISLSPNYI